MPKLTLPPHLLNEVEAGNVVLFLGAGASFNSLNDKNEKPPLGAALAKLIAKKFLTEAYEKYPLNQVAALAISQSDLFTFQKFIGESYSNFQPTEAHTKLKTFRWKGIATTNYDTIVEEAYREKAKPAAQHLVTFIDHSDRPDEQLADKNDVLYIKLHGCVTRIANEQCPLILTIEQYNTHQTFRKRLFNRLYEWAAEKPILFAGYSLQDPNLIHLIQQLQKEVPSFPRSYLITPSIDDIQKTYWEKFRITAIKGTFDELAESLDKNIGGLFRGIRPSSETGYLAIRDRFIRKDADIPHNTSQFLERDVDYVKSVIPEDRIDPKQFYKGVHSEWSAIDQNLDVSRHLTETILLDHILSDEGTRPNVRCFILIKAHAGAGKSVLLQRLAWEASKRHEKLCLKVRPGGSINSAAIADLLDQTHEHIFLFVDNVIERHREIAALYDGRSAIADRITVIAVARTNEWNIASEGLRSLATDVFDLPYLSTKEVDELLKKLEDHGALGTLEKLNHKQRQEAFLEIADRQLLVALHEATLGEPFEKIIRNEFETITPSRAQNIYLTICLLHQFGVPVRAGIISRMYGVPFEEFQRTFFSPLEQIIISSKDPKSNDMCYMARHPHIAEIVVSTVLSNKEDLFHEVIKAVRYLNPSFSSDRVAFRRLLHGRSLLENFPDHQMVLQIFDLAEEVSGEDADLLQQKCIYEMLRPNANYAVAEKLILKAISISKRTRALFHTQSELLIRRAEASAQHLDRKNYLARAIIICEDLKRFRDNAFPFYTLTKIRTLQIKDELRSDEPSDDQIYNLVRIAEKTLQEGIAKHPDNPYLRSAEANLATVLSEYERAVSAMEKSFELNPRNSLIALRLASHYLHVEALEKAVETLRKALAAKTSDTRLHSMFAKILVDHFPKNNEEIIHHLRKSFAPGDNNLESRLLLGRQLFLNGKLEDGTEIFNELRQRHIAPEVRNRLRFGTDDTHRGEIQYVEATYCIISRVGDSARIYCNRFDISKKVWHEIYKGCKVRFLLAFCMSGARAHSVEVE